MVTLGARRRVAVNTSLNFLGSAIPAAVGIVTIPLIVRSLGDARFGILSLAWAVMMYFTAFDLGVGRAITKYAAEMLGEGERDRVGRLLWTALALQVGLGVAGGVVLGLAAPAIVERLVRTPVPLIPEARGMLRLLGVWVPLAVAIPSLRSLLEAAQRFDLVNGIRMSSNTLIFLIPAAAGLLGAGLVEIAVLLIIVQVLSGVALAIMVHRVFPQIRGPVRVERGMMGTLLGYGGWVTVYSLIIPAIIYADRFLIGHLRSLAALTYYVVPFEMLLRLQILPSSLTMAMFPVFSLLGRGRREELAELYGAALRFLVVIAGVLTLGLVFGAEDILRWWLGAAYAANSTIVFQILAIAFFLNWLQWLPNALMLGLGRPDLVAKLFLADLLLHLPIVWLLVARFGIIGAAAAVLVRSVVELLVLFGCAWRVAAFSLGTFRAEGLIRAAVATAVLLAVAPLVIRGVPAELISQAIIRIGVVTAFALLSWRYVLSRTDRAHLLATVLFRPQTDRLL